MPAFEAGTPHTTMADSNSSFPAAAFEALFGVAILLPIVFSVLVGVCLVLLMHMLIKVISKHPKHPALWIPIGCLVGFILLALITRGQVQLVFGCLAIFSTLAVFIAARAVDLYYDQLFPDNTKTVQATMNKLLGKHWWSDKQTQLLS